MGSVGYMRRLREDFFLKIKISGKAKYSSLKKCVIEAYKERHF